MSTATRLPKTDGLCECGCGEKTRIAPQTDRKRGWVRGEPIRFKQGHNPGPGAPPLEAPSSYYVVLPSGCWEWTGTRNKKGYGKYAHHLAHRLVYEEEVGPIPAGLELDHLCRSPACVNPAHLEPVSHRENLLRGDTIAARNAAKTHCVRGHPFDDRNTRTRPDGSRECRTCGAEGARARYRRKKQQKEKPAR